MTDKIEIPKCSKISVQQEKGNITFSWFKHNRNFFQTFMAIFMIAWLGAWCAGLKSTIRQLIENPDNSNNIFLIFWLICWIIAGGFAVSYIYLLLRPQKPQEIKLAINSFSYDSGVSTPIPQIGFYHRRNPFHFWAKAFERRKILLDIPKGATKFVYQESLSRIYFDWESCRYEVGEGLSEPEIEWLYEQLENWKKV